MEIILKYFPDLEPLQKEKLALFGPVFKEWNEKVNLVSRKDIDFLYERHVLHSLSLAKIITFKPGTRIIDVGTGGGFPGIPLAILFPETQFLLVDSIGKKVKVVQSIAQELHLPNVETMQTRSEDLRLTVDFVLARAVASIPDFLKLTNHLVDPIGINDLNNGILYLKGGDFTTELLNLRKKYTVYNLDSFFTEGFLSTKKIIHIFWK